MAELELTLPSDAMWSGFDQAEKGVVDTNTLFNEDLMHRCERSPQTVPEDINAINNDLWVPQNQTSPAPEYQILNTVKASQSQSSALQFLTSPDVFSSSDIIYDGVFDWENCPSPQSYPQTTAPLAESPLTYESQFSTDLSHVARPVDEALYDDFPSPTLAQPLAPGKIQLITPPARYNKRKAPAQKAAPAISPARRGRGTKGDPKSSVKRHREKISNYLESAPKIIGNLNAVNDTMAGHLRELDEMRQHLFGMLSSSYVVPQGAPY